MDQKLKKIIALLPDNKQIFTEYAQFQTVQTVPNTIRNQYFEDNIQDIALQFAQFYEKDTDEINKDDIIMDFMDWLEGGNVKFKLNTGISKQKQQKNNKLNQKEKQPVLQAPQIPQIPQASFVNKNIVIQQSQATKYTNNSPKTLSPRPERRQTPYMPQTPPPTQSYLQQQKPTYYQQNPQTQQGRPNVVRYNQPAEQSAQFSQSSFQQYQPHPQQANQTQDQIHHQQPATKKAQTIEKQNTNAWLDNLSKCLTYPQKRFYILSQMNAKRKY